MTIGDMKRVLVQKFKDENCCFRYSDISIKKTKAPYNWDGRLDDAYEVVIREYEHIRFEIFYSTSEIFGKEVWVTRREVWNGEVSDGVTIIMEDSEYKDFDELTKTALVRLGYYIASRF